MSHVFTCYKVNLTSRCCKKKEETIFLKSFTWRNSTKWFLKRLLQINVFYIETCLFLRWVAPRNLWQPLPSVPSPSCTCHGTSGGGKARGGLCLRSGSRSALSSSLWPCQWPVKPISDFGFGLPTLVVTQSVWHVATGFSHWSPIVKRWHEGVLFESRFKEWFFELKWCQRSYWKREPRLQVYIRYSIILIMGFQTPLPV